MEVEDSSAGMNEEQLLEFCQRLGLAGDGYLDESQLNIICRCIGFSISDEAMKDLFEELDMNHDGKVSISNLCFMLKTMGTTPSSGSSSTRSSPEKKLPTSKPADSLSKSFRGQSASSVPGVCSASSSVTEKDQGITFGFSLLDPLRQGTTKVESLLDYWSSIGLNQEVGLQVLNHFGLETNYESTLDLNDIEKCIEEEIYSNKSMLPWIQVALLMYRSEVQFLKASLETACHEKVKLQSINEELTKQSQMLAQEIDEQNTKLELTNKLLMDNLVHKYEEQISELKSEFNSEKCLLTESIKEYETTITSMKEEETRAKIEMIRLQSENKTLEKEIERLNESLRNLQDSKSVLENEICIYENIQKNLQDMELKSIESSRKNDEKLSLLQAEVQILRDTNDELNSQLVSMKEEFKNFRMSYVFKSNGLNSCCLSRGEDEGGGDTSPLTSLASLNIEAATLPAMSLDKEERLALSVMNSTEDTATEQKSTQTDEFSQAICDQSFEKKLKDINDEKVQLQKQITELEENINLMAQEYEKTEDYWSNKLAEERLSYEAERHVNDEKLREIQEKIREYEELLSESLGGTNHKLNPVPEYWSLEKQIGEMECENYEMRGIVEKFEKEIEDFKMKFEDKLRECNSLEAEMKNLNLKCQEYEDRISALLMSNDEERADSKLNELESRKREDELLARIMELEEKLRIVNEADSNKKSFLIDSSYPCAKSMPHFNTCINTNRGTSFVDPTMNQRIKYTHVDINYLTQLKQKCKQYEEQCWSLTQTILDKEKYSEQLLAEMKYQHTAEIQNYETLIATNQQIINRQLIQIQNQEQVIKELMGTK